MKRAGIILLILVAGVSLFLWYIKANPPLNIMSWGTVDYTDNQGLRGIEITIENNGFMSLRLEKVYINENETPEAAELGISRIAMVQMLTPNENSEKGISFHKLDEFPVKPQLTPKQTEKLSSQDKKVINNYGIWVQNFDKPIDKITIKYRYLGMPFTLQMSLGQ